MITKFHKGKQKIKVIKNSKMDFYLVAGSRSFTHVQISWLVDSFYMIPFLNKTKYMFDNLAYDDSILRSLKICNFRNIGVYFRFKTVDLNSIQNSIILFPQDKIYSTKWHAT